MNPNQLDAMSASELSEHFRWALQERRIAQAQDALAQLQSRFQRLTATIRGSQEFLDDFLPLGGSSEVRSLHISEPLAACITRLECLLELAGERARVQTEEATLHQIVASRERGLDLIRALSVTPNRRGLTAGELAVRLEVSPSNLSPLIRAFHVHGIIDRCQHGKNVFLKLTPQGRALVNLAPVVNGKHVEESGREVLREAMREVVRDMLDTPFPSKRGILGAAEHGLRRVEEQYRVSNPMAAAILGAFREEIKRSMGIVSEAAREVAGAVLNDLHPSPNSAKQETADIIQTQLARQEKIHRETAPLASLFFRAVSEEVRRETA